MPTARVDEPCRNFGVHHLGREAQGRHLRRDEPAHVAVGPRRLAIGVELGAVGQEKSAGAQPRRRVRQVGAVHPGQRCTQGRGAGFGSSP